MIEICEERPEHHLPIAILHHATFGGNYEADLVENLRRDGLVVASLIATQDSDIIGHALFSDLDVEVDGRPVKAAALAPLVVKHDHRSKGIGAQLIERGLDLLRARGRDAVIVLGDHAYYGRFGFSPRPISRLKAPFQGDAFLALELVPGVLGGRPGVVHYPPAFKIDTNVHLRR